MIRCEVLNRILVVNYGTLQVFAINGTITPSCNESLDAELRKL